jgi:D-glycerate 3-kinase
MGIAPHPGIDPAWIQRILDSAGARAGAGVRVLGLSAVQGSGKSTLAAALVQAARAAGLSARAVSLDDFYLTRARREALARQVHPLLLTRGPPGSHDLALALDCMAAIRDGHCPPLPAFDKLADERLPLDHWQPPGPSLDLLVLEGWCLGVPAEDAHGLARPINALEREEDPAGVWRGYCNQRLAQDYPALWQQIDVLWYLQPPDFGQVLAWRGEQERQLCAHQPGRVGLDGPALARFVQHFERLSRQGMRTLPALATHLALLDRQRRLRLP